MWVGREAKKRWMCAYSERCGGMRKGDLAKFKAKSTNERRATIKLGNRTGRSVDDLHNNTQGSDRF